jgi:hypothetical protein
LRPLTCACVHILCSLLLRPPRGTPPRAQTMPARLRHRQHRKHLPAALPVLTALVLSSSLTKNSSLQQNSRARQRTAACSRTAVPQPAERGASAAAALRRHVHQAHAAVDLQLVERRANVRRSTASWLTTRAHPQPQPMKLFTELAVTPIASKPHSAYTQRSSTQQHRSVYCATPPQGATFTARSSAAAQR